MRLGPGAAPNNAEEAYITFPDLLVGGKGTRYPLPQQLHPTPGLWS